VTGRGARRLGPLAEPQFRLLFLGEVVSFAGSAFAPIAMAFAVLELTGSASDLGLVLAAGWAPQIVFVLLGGVVGDRLPRNLVMVGSNLVSGASQATVAALLLTAEAQLWHLAALQALRGMALAFFFPASQGVIPQTVPARLLQQANALFRLSLTSTGIVGAAVAGVVVAGVGPGWALAFDAATYLASAAILSRMRVAGTVALGEHNLLRELGEGWTEFRSRTWLWSVVVGAGIGNLVWTGSSGVLGPLVAKQSLGGAGAWGAIVAGESVGLLVGGLLALRLRPARPLRIGTIALLGIPIFLAALAVPAPTPLVALAAVPAGVGLELFNVSWATALQQHVPQERLARVSSYDALGSFVLIPAGFTLAGPAADAFGVSVALWGAAAVSAAATLAVLAVRDVRELPRRDDELPELAPVPEPGPL
jgi:MFS family permease